MFEVCLCELKTIIVLLLSSISRTRLLHVDKLKSKDGQVEYEGNYVGDKNWKRVGLDCIEDPK